MGKKIFILIIVLMSVALIGIISVQVFWIKNTIQITEEQFTSNVRFALAKVSEDIKEDEFNAFYLDIVENFKDEGTKLKYSDVRKYIYEKIDTTNNERFTYSQSIIEENYKVPTEFFENDSIDFKEIFRKEEIVIVKDQSLDNKGSDINAPEERYLKIGRFEGAEKSQLERAFDISRTKMPIHKRVSNQELTLRLDRELKSKGITTNFKYGIYSNGLATQVKSGYFRKETGKSYMVPMFTDSEGNSNFQLFVTFPEKKNFILSSISKILVLSVFFIFIIILAFVTALYQLIKQKQISEIKTDFINNMTHEFKTPIATINLALDAIKNPKIIEDKEKVMRYVQMIRDENKRMHGQVENVLRISKLEKNQLDVSKEKIDLKEVIEEAITHVDLIIKDKGGYIKTHFNAKNNEILANHFHLTNVIVNVLDNAIKYSEDAPKVEVTTENTAKNIIIKVSDQGIGMNKSVQKNIFKKFYREERGNIHNVKGHGLGLSYVKKIVEIHQGDIYVESEKGQGSTFTIKLPLI
ncbi:sensor histidine kinase [Lutibacter maritimus]|jgi:two-component system phosphate regulon sensor histidine kinase PhoR|uniref:histidine kinase n=1 Tax=Lutibacter maritimus TaxID=593133 RepID=A0A1I6NQA0_9FLAO|nr:HAMP domain-containing sensor histidine kinase [Lutibacter maritimus]SFS30108.1 two-component system, OmpR family, phosphate regulon sensor histidine kinase PhoR [Lutibacter maritimus]